MAKRQRKTESDYLKARSALMRSIQRTNKSFGSDIKISDIVDVPTPAQAKKMSAAELRKMTRRIQSARTEKGEKVTFVPTGAGGVTKVRTKDYNAAMAALGKRNKALQQRLDVIEKAKVPKSAGARPVSARKVQPDKSKSKVMPVEKIDPMTAFVGGKAFGNVDEIQKRFKDRGKVFAEAPREWKKNDEIMRKNFLKMIGFHDAGLAKKLEKLTNQQLLWATYEGNLPALLEASRYKITDPVLLQQLGLAEGIDQKEADGLAAAAAKMISDLLDTASKVVFE